MTVRCGDGVNLMFSSAGHLAVVAPALRDALQASGLEVAMADIAVNASGWTRGSSLWHASGTPFEVTLIVGDLHEALAALARLPAHQHAIGPVLGCVDFPDPSLVAARIQVLRGFSHFWTLHGEGQGELEALLDRDVALVTPRSSLPSRGGTHPVSSELREDCRYMLLHVDAGSNWHHANFAGALEGFRRFRASGGESELRLLVVLRRGAGAAHLRAGIARDHADLSLHVAESFADLDQLGPLVDRVDGVLDCARLAGFDSVTHSAALLETPIVATAVGSRALLGEDSAWWIPLESAGVGTPRDLEPDQVARALAEFELAPATERLRRVQAARASATATGSDRAFAEIVSTIADLAGDSSWSPRWLFADDGAASAPSR